MRKQDIIASSGKTGPSAPGQPTGTNDGVSRPFNDGKINVSFPAPFDGKLAITSYTVTPSPATIPPTISGPSSPIAVTGLTSDTDYTFTVTATNGVGTSVPSPASIATKATTVPQTPTAITLSNIRFKDYGTNPEIGVNVSGGFATGGSARTGWDYSTDNGANYKTITDSTGLIFTLPTQSNNAAFVAGGSYSALIRARNVNGPGGTFNASPVQVGTVPQQPPAPSVTRTNNTTASLSFTLGNNGGLTVTGINVITNPVVSTGIQWTGGTTSPLTVTGTFVSGQSYQFFISATNSAGTSTTSSASNPLIVNTGVTPNFPTPNFPNFPNFPTPNFPTPNFPNFPNFPQPNFPNFPNFPQPNFPNFPNFPCVPNFGEFCVEAYGCGLCGCCPYPCYISGTIDCTGQCTTSGNYFC